MNVGTFVKGPPTTEIYEPDLDSLHSYDQKCYKNWQSLMYFFFNFYNDNVEKKKNYYIV